MLKVEVNVLVNAILLLLFLRRIKFIVIFQIPFPLGGMVNLIFFDVEQGREGYTIIQFLVLHGLEIHFESFEVY